MQTTMNFVTPGPDGAVRFVLDNAWTGTRQRTVSMQITDVRPRVAELSLEREGFVLDRIVSGVTDYRDLGQLETMWKPAVKETVLRVTGGTWATLFAGPLARFSERDRNAFSSAVSAPARAVHSDLHRTFQYEQFPRQPHAEAAAAELRERYGDTPPRRWRVFNVWQMISPPPQDTLLALCALDSTTGDDFVEGKGFFAEPGVEAEVQLSNAGQPQFDISFVRESLAQRWCYVSDMLPGEALIFSTFDPTADARRARVPHGAFDVSPASPTAVPRNSIEIRALVAFDG